MVERLFKVVSEERLDYVDKFFVIEHFIDKKEQIDTHYQYAYTEYNLGECFQHIEDHVELVNDVNILIDHTFYLIGKNSMSKLKFNSDWIPGIGVVYYLFNSKGRKIYEYHCIER